MIPVIRGGQQRHSGLSPSSTSFQASVGIGMGARFRWTEKGDLLIREGLPSRSDDKARPKGMFQCETSTQKYLAESEFYPPTLTISY